MHRNHEFENASALHREAVQIAMAHLDDLGIPEDSLCRGIAEVQVACNAVPPLKVLIREMWPMPQALLQ